MPITTHFESVSNAGGLVEERLVPLSERRRAEPQPSPHEVEPRRAVGYQEPHRQPYQAAEAEQVDEEVGRRGEVGPDDDNDLGRAGG